MQGLAHNPKLAVLRLNLFSDMARLLPLSHHGRRQPSVDCAFRNSGATQLLSFSSFPVPRLLPFIRLALAGLFCVSLGVAAFAESDRFARCRAADIEARIVGCTQFIARGSRETKRNKITAYINRGGAYRAKGDLDRAIVDFGRALQLDPKSADALTERASIYMAKGDIDRALADYSAAIAAEPKSATAYYKRGETYRAQKDLDRAIADFDEALQLDKNLAAAYVARASVYRTKGDLDEALVDFDKAVTLYPKSASLRIDRGVIYQAKGDFDEALADYDVAIEIDPKSTEAFLARAKAYRDKQDLEHARQDVEAVLKLDPQLASAKELLNEVNGLMAQSASRPTTAAAKRPSPLTSEVLFHVGPVPITRPVVTTWAIIALLTIGSWLVTRRLKLIPERRQAVLELAVTGIMKQIEDVIRKDSRPFLPLLGTLFIFLAAANLSGLLPEGEAPTSKLETPAALALIVFFSVHFFGVRTRGFFGYLASFAEPKLIMLPLNVISEVTRTFSLMVRLFGNVMSGEFVIALVVALAGLFVPIPLMLLEVLVGIVQAYIFTVLATVFIGAAIGSAEVG